MHGLLRVRGFTQDDAHIFCTRDQIVSEIEGCLDFAEAVLKTFGFVEYRVELSTHQPGNSDFIGTPEEWAESEGALRDVLTKRGLTFQSFPGEAAFYGPKIDVKLVDVLGRLWQLSTVQFDFNLPKRFELEYIGEDGAAHQPVMVHRALFGSVERFFGVLIEHYAGAFPMWLAPVQVGLVPISNEKHLEYAESVKARLEAAGLRVELDASNGKMQSKIRDFGLQKIPFILILGDKEAATDSVSVRVRAKGDEGSVTLEEFLARAKTLVAEHSMGL
jgi:threonyl-tRNA synthetase